MKKNVNFAKNVTENTAVNTKNREQTSSLSGTVGGLRIKGLRKIAGATRDLNPRESRYFQLNFDRSTGEVFYNDLYSIGCNNWVQYHDPAIVFCGNLNRKTTMKEIREMIVSAINHADRGVDVW